MTVEFGRIFGVSSLPEAERVLELVGRPNAAILLDNFHADRAGHTNADVAAVNPAHITYAQVCDAPAVSVDSSPTGLRVDAVDERCNLGRGGLPWRSFIEALPADTPLSLEIRSADLRSRFTDATDRAVAVHEATLAALS